jgi:predicted nucleic acid-binding protein
MTHKASNFNLNRIFVDTNVLVGGYSGDVRFQKDADCLHYLYSLTGKRLYVSSLSVAQLISVYQKGGVRETTECLVEGTRKRTTKLCA